MSCFIFVKNPPLDVSLSLKKYIAEATYQSHQKIAGFYKSLYIKISNILENKKIEDKPYFIIY